MSETKTTYLLGIVIAICLAMRIVNLNYNSPFNDEAIYTVIGRLGLFQGDWWSYNANSWMAGQPYIYPPLSAIAYQTGGIVGSRLLSVFFGLLTVETMFSLTKLIFGEDRERKGNIAGIVAAVIAGTTTVGLYVSRLATYDAPSFFLLFLSLTYLYRAQLPSANYGRLYFLALIFLVLAFLTKIVIALYLPFIFLISGFLARSNTNKWKYWVKYFALPFGLLLGIYAAFNLDNIMTYAKSQGVRDKNGLEIIFYKFWFHTKYVWMLWFGASVPVILNKKVKFWATYTTAALFIIIFHLLTQREPTLDKHVYLSILFLTPIIGMGTAYFIKWIDNPIYRSFAVADVSVILLFFAYLSYVDIHYFNNMWEDSSKVLTYLKDNIKMGDKVLAEVGAGAILATFEKNYPPYTTTFDWFQYGELTGKQAYLSALNDGYFDWIELDSNSQTSKSIHSSMHNMVVENLSENYKEVFSSDGFVVFKRSF